MQAEIFDNLDQGIIITDNNGYITLINRVALELTGYEAAEVVGQLCLWDFCDKRQPSPLFRDNLEKGRSFPAEDVSIAPKDNVSIKLGVRVTPLYGNSQTLTGALAVIRAVGKIYAIEQNQKAFVRMEAIGRIVSAIAHEINNPLQSIRTILELSKSPKRTAEQKQKYLEAADTEISRIVSIIGQMRSFYRPAPTSAPPLADVNVTVLKTLALLEEVIAESEIQVEAKLAPKLMQVRVMDYQLEQIILNLITQALSTTTKGGKLSVTTERISDSISIILYNSVASESGEINNFLEQHSNIIAGMSLGLSVSKEIIEEIGGKIELDTSEGIRVALHLPI
ncbi:histidine kinase dimerization/phospho-acceptor domain-containing protein [Candidatus Chlorohelix sp.]|uniref:histidine kinase dimerization/phospho-acceptor domain-containing protein n=1 Tax=Candidatus Chlorohelix sp. TaxID=3139201 RepID=UPI0030474E05